MKYSICDIVKNGLCTGCGLCVSESKTSSMEWDRYGFLVPKLDDSFDDMAVKVCPFNPAPEKEVHDEDKLGDIFLQESQYKDARIGRYENIYVGYAVEYRGISSSGGIATYIFEQLLKQGIVQHLFIVKELNGSYAYQWFSDAGKIKEISKTRYIPVTLEQLFREIDITEGKIAVSGVACFIKAVRLKQYYYPHLKEKIPFLAGIICGGLKSRFFSEYLAQKSGIEGTYKRQEYRIKDLKSTASDYSFGAFDKKDEFHQIKMRTLGDMWGTGLFKNNACDFCDDVTTELADISLGDAWLQPYVNDGAGTSVIVVRSKLAGNLINEGIKDSSLSVEKLSLERLKASLEGSLKHRQKATAYRIKLKRKTQSVFPQKRERLFQHIPIEFKLVQKLRVQLREKSLLSWEKETDARQFDNDMAPLKEKLALKTKLYHYIQRIKGRLGIKEI